MSMELKKQSNPFSTGGGGVNFETRVQAAFALSLFRPQGFVHAKPYMHVGHTARRWRDSM